MPNIQQQTSDDRFLVIALKQDDKQAFTRLFHTYYKDLVLFGGSKENFSGSSSLAKIGYKSSAFSGCLVPGCNGGIGLKEKGGFLQFPDIAFPC